jgi:mannose-1-phosphate guanylyltransferase/mannose-6-phosphate isomerase
MKILHITPVILSGGSGSRLWPLSRATFPKQFLVLSGKTTLFQEAIKRINNLQNSHLKVNETLIVTNEEHRFLAMDQLRELKEIKAKLLLEPEGRNTAPALTLAALQALDQNEDSILVVTPSDQLIEDLEAFNHSLASAIHEADLGSIVILGIHPTKPDIGFGYIHKEDNRDISLVKAFTEKPDLKTAESYIHSGNYFWNSGIFVMRASLWLKAIQHFRIDIYEATLKAFQNRTIDDVFIRPNQDLFNLIPSESIDYAVIEKIPESDFIIKMVELNAGWNDLGTWDAVWQSGKKDADANVIFGDVLLEDTKNSLIYADHKLVTTLGLDHVVVVETSDALLIANRDRMQDVKLIVKKLKDQTREEQLLHRKVNRPWGWYDTLEEGDRFKVKRIQVNPGASLSLQKHTKRAEHWVVIKGEAEIICEDKTIYLKENESTYIAVGQMHRLSNPGKALLEIIEIQSGDYLGEDDIERFEDHYGRVN